MTAYDDRVRPEDSAPGWLVWPLRLIALAIVVPAQLLRALVRRMLGALAAAVGTVGPALGGWAVASARAMGRLLQRLGLVALARMIGRALSALGRGARGTLVALLGPPARLLRRLVSGLVSGVSRALLVALRGIRAVLRGLRRVVGPAAAVLAALCLAGLRVLLDAFAWAGERSWRVLSRCGRALVRLHRVTLGRLLRVLGSAARRLAGRVARAVEPLRRAVTEARASLRAATRAVGGSVRRSRHGR